MTKVKMLKTVKGSPDGIQVNVYQQNVEYDLNDSLLESFVEQGVIELVNDKPKEKPAPQENKAIESVEENKAEEAPKRKSRKRKSK
jgi:hypothetical protein